MPLGTSARIVDQGGCLWYRAPALSLVPRIVHGLTHASLGNFSLTTDDDPAAVQARRRALLIAAGLNPERVVAPGLHHTANVAVVDNGRIPDGRWDAVVAAESEVTVAVTVADCVPVFFVDVVGGAFGVAHAGWRGLVGGIVKRTVETLVEQFGARTGNLLVGTGPAIRGPSYEVGPEVAGLFPEAFSIPSGDPAVGRALLDLPSCALAQAAAARVPRDNLVDFSLDTFLAPGDLFSHRRGERARHWAFVGVRNDG